jgi:hypothetical protein
MKLVFLNNEIICVTDNLEGMSFGENDDNIVITTLDSEYDPDYDYSYDVDTLVATQGTLKVVDPAVEQQLLDDWNSIKYQEDRKNIYPDIGDQLDDLFHAGAFSDDMAAKIQAVKDAHPKPEE